VGRQRDGRKTLKSARKHCIGLHWDGSRPNFRLGRGGEFCPAAQPSTPQVVIGLQPLSPLPHVQTPSLFKAYHLRCPVRFGFAQNPCKHWFGTLARFKPLYPCRPGGESSSFSSSPSSSIFKWAVTWRRCFPLMHHDSRITIHGFPSKLTFSRGCYERFYKWLSGRFLRRGKVILEERFDRWNSKG